MSFTRISKPACAGVLVCIAALSFSGPSPGSAADPGFFPFGVFDKSDSQGRFDNKSYAIGSTEWMDYRTRLLEVFLKYNINTVINAPYKNDNHTRKVLDQLHSNGIRVVFQPGNPFNRKSPTSIPGCDPFSLYRHPSVIAYKLGNEPKTEEKLHQLADKYALIRQCLDKPIVTAMIGEIMGSPDPGVELHLKGPTDDMTPLAWSYLNTRVLFARHYAIRRDYDLLNWSRHKMKMPFHRWCAHMEKAAAGRPWWYAAQMFGKGKDKTRKSYWRLPTSAETNAMIHTALANGARGIIGWGIPAYDVTRKPTRRFFIDQHLQAEKARDGSVPMEQYGRIAALVSAHADLLLRHIPKTLALQETNSEVLKVPRVDPKTGALYVYVVNLNTEAVNQAVFTIPASETVTRAKDIYTDSPVAMRKLPSGAELSRRLAPGEALFIRLD